MAEPVSHDQNFKNLIVDYPREALDFFAAQEAPLAHDAARVVPVREEQLQERLGGRYRRLDVPLLAEWDDGRREAILFVVEEESDGRRFSPQRLAHYCLDLAGMFGTARVVPVVVFLRPGAAPGLLTLGTERRAYLTFDYVACSLGDMPAEDWLDSGNVVARVNLPNMRRPSHLSWNIRPRERSDRRRMFHDRRRGWAGGGPAAQRSEAQVRPWGAQQGRRLRTRRARPV